MLIRLNECTVLFEPLLFAGKTISFSRDEAHVMFGKVIKAIQGSGFFLQKCHLISPYKHSVLFVGHRQTVQIQIRLRKMQYLIRIRHCLLKEYFVKS